MHEFDSRLCLARGCGLAPYQRLDHLSANSFHHAKAFEHDRLGLAAPGHLARQELAS